MDADATTKAVSDLIIKVQAGVMTPKEAEAEAERLGVGPIEGCRNPERFDPLQESRWTLAMAVAWITWRDIDVVRAQMDGYRANCSRWREHSQGWLLEQYKPVSVSDLLLSQDLDENNEEPGARMPVRQAASHELWRKLLDDRFRAEGRDISTGRRVVIPACEWLDLWPNGSSTGHPNSVRSYDQGRVLSGYDDVLVRRDDVLKLWPEREPVHVSKSSAVKQATRWLVSVMRASKDEPTMTRSTAIEQAMGKFDGLSERGAGRAWAAAISEAEAPAWRRPGPRKSPH